MPEGLAQRSLGNLPGDEGRFLPRVAWRGGGNKYSESAPSLDHALLLQRPVGVLDRVRVQLQFCRQFAGGGQSLGGPQNSDRNAADDLVSNLAVNRPRVVFPDLH